MSKVGDIVAGVPISTGLTILVLLQMLQSGQKCCQLKIGCYLLIYTDWFKDIYIKLYIKLAACLRLHNLTKA